ncbi:F-box domain containing protein [Pandoravirus neocaledonia]|uniref:F-box domain containing protein n=1 Tax=Pandoravirus neocaledonia TaxID=2107708 RepID=A0A2U7UE36_9VIRU|nr:F-box domain containing protein [Pandoravirus neocaledonia]AVK76672.1 F-box domain containing protein [Pandoravirus neocaledonia]
MENINVALYDDILYRIFDVDLGMALVPVVARVCKRWRAIANAIPLWHLDQFVEQTATTVVAADAAPARLLVGWAARVRSLAARTSVCFLHTGHLIEAVVHGQGTLAAWIRRQQQPWVECDPKGKCYIFHLCGSEPATCTEASFFCPRCRRGREADTWPWTCAARVGNIGAVLADLDALITVRGPITERQRRCWASALDRVLPIWGRSADIAIVSRFFDDGLFRRPWGSRPSIWKAAAAARRLDLLRWGRATGHDRLHDAYRPEQSDAKRPSLSRAAAKGGHVDALEWIDAVRAGSSGDHDVFYDALEGGHTAVLDWLADKHSWMPKSHSHLYTREAARHALQATSTASLRWLRVRRFRLSRGLLRHEGREGAAWRAQAGSTAVVAYVVDTLGCEPCDALGLIRASKADRLDLVRDAHERGWINDNGALYERMWLGAIKKGAAKVASWLGANPPPGTTSRPPFGRSCRGGAYPPIEMWARERCMGVPWHPRKSFEGNGERCANAECVLWALAQGCPLPKRWRKSLSPDSVIIACARSIMHDKHPTSHLHPHPLYLPTAAPLSCMDALEAASIQARIDVARVVCDKAGSWSHDDTCHDADAMDISLFNVFCGSATPSEMTQHLRRIIDGPRPAPAPPLRRPSKRKWRRASKKARPTNK